MNKHTRQAKGPDGTCGFRRARGMGPPTSSTRTMSTSPTSTTTNSRMMFATRKKKEKTMDEALNQALTREVQILRRDNERLRIENDELRTSQHRNELTKQTQWHVEAVKSLTEKLNETAELLNAEKQRSERLGAEVIRLKRILERFSPSAASPSSTSSNYLRSSPTTSSSPSSPRFCMEEEAMEEAESLESIYGEGFMRYSDGSYRITIPVVKTSRSSALWSLLCRPTRGYPSSSPMQFSIESSGPHNIQAHELNRVKGDMMSQYCPGEVAVFGWVEHLKSALHALVNTKRTVAW